MKAPTLLLCLFVALSFGQDTPPIWSITGGPIGIGSCYDIVTEDITFPAYEFHYETQNVMNVNNVNYLVPDEVFGYSSPEFVNDSRVIIMDTFTYYYHEYVSSWSISAGITIDGVTLNFAFSHTKGEIDGYLNNSINYFAENVLQWSQFTMEMWPGGTLHPHFLAEVNKLPLVYDPAAYGQFILYFGTHVIYKCFYGASINFTSVFHSDLVNKWGIEWVENQVKLSISYMQFNAGINWNDFSNTTSINDSFIEYAQNVTITVGGQPAYLEAYGFKAWWQSVQTNYAVLFPKAYIMPLSSIVPNPQIAANLKQAIIAYGNGKLPIANRRGKGNHKHKT